MKSKFFALFVLLMLFTVACTRVQEPSAIPAQTTPSANEEPMAVPEPVAETKPPQAPPAQIMKSVIELDADDDGFYLDGEQIGVVTVKKNQLLELTFNVRENEVYYGGLDFRGCGQDAEAKPGKSVTLTFTPVANCIIKSYWPASGVLKDSIELRAE